MTALLDRLADRSTRHEVLELAFIAHALIDPHVLATVAKTRARFREYAIELSPAAVSLLTLVAESPAAARVDLASLVDVALTFDHDAHVDDVIRLARQVEELSVGDLASLGTARLILSLLEGERHERRLAQRDHRRRTAA